MARTTTRFGSRLDLLLFGVCAVLALVVTILPPTLHAPLSSGLRRSAVAPLIGLQQGAERWRAAWVSSYQRALTQDSLALRAAEATAMRVENDRLRRLLGLGQRLQWGFVVADALQGGGSAEQFAIVLTAGSAAGVQSGSPVVAPEGLIGTVQTVDPTMSLAILYPHSEFRASAMAADGSSFGIVSPHISGGGQTTVSAQVVRPDRYMLELRDVPFRKTLNPGTLIVTSGLGGTEPSGIPIGTVVAELKTPEVWARTYLVRPVVNPAEITSVMILLPQKVRQGTGSVWEAPVSVDSATRGVVAAGDSLNRAAATLEAARRAALDSAVRASRPDTTSRPDSLRADSVRGIRIPGSPAAAPPAAFRPPGGGPTSGARPTVPPAGAGVTPRPVARPDTARRPDTLRTRPR